jgi:hypothetical protein
LRLGSFELNRGHGIEIGRHGAVPKKENVCEVIERI